MEEVLEIRNFLSRRPWYRRPFFEVLLVVAALSLVAAGAFAIAVGYYAWKLAHADAARTPKAALTANGLPEPAASERVPTQIPRAVGSHFEAGSLQAKLTIAEFADFGCPASREASFIMRELATKYPNKLRYIFFDFPLPGVYQDSGKAALAARCVGEQGKFWAYHDRLFAHQNAFSDDDLIKYADQVGVNLDQFNTCVQTMKYQPEVDRDLRDGLARGITGTPTFFINGRRIDGLIPKDQLEKLLNRF